MRVRACFSGEHGNMRTTSALFSAIAATILGLFGVVILGASGLSWSGSGFAILEYSDSDDSERFIGLVMGVLALVSWLLLSVALAWLAGRDSGRGGRVAIWITLSAGVLLVLGLFVAILSSARLPSP